MDIKLKRTLESFSLILFLILVVYQGPKLVGFVGGAFDENAFLQQFNTYSNFAIYSIIGIVIILILMYAIKYKDERYGDSISFNSLGEYPAISFFRRFSVLQLTFLSLIIFLSIGLFVFLIKQQSFTGTGIPVLQQQVTPFSSLLFSSFLVPIAENLDAQLIIAFFIFILALYARKYNIDRGSYTGYYYLILIAGISLFGVANHLLRYSGSELSLLTVALFWGIIGLLTALTGSIIPGLIFHFVNNLLYDLNKYFSADFATLTIGITLFLFIVFYLFTYRNKLLGDKNINKINPLIEIK